MIVAHPSRHLGLLSVFAIVLCCGRGVQGADPVFVVHQPLTHTLSPAGGDVLDILVSSAERVAAPFASIVQIRSPRGELMPHDAMTITGPAALNQTGTSLKLTIKDPGRFTASGDYMVTIRLGGTVGKEVRTQLISITLQAPPPVLNTDRLQNTTFRAWRAAPWKTASLSETLRVEEVGGRSKVHHLKASADGPYVKGTMERSGKAVTRLAGVSNGNDETGMTLAARGHADVTLDISGLNGAGIHTMSLILTSPTLGAPVSVPLVVEVADRWLFPFITIALGVVIGSLLRHLSQVARPRERARLRGVLLEAQLTRWRERTRDPQSIQQLDEVESLLVMSREHLELREPTAATTALDQAHSALAAFGKVWRERFNTVAGKLRETGDDLEAVGGLIPSTDAADLERLTRGRSELREAQQAMSAFDLPAAESRIAAGLAVVETLRAKYAQGAPRQRGLAPGRRQQTVTIAIAEPPEDRIAGRQLTFSLVDPADAIPDGSEFRWEFGDGAIEVSTTAQATHRYGFHGAYRAMVSVAQGGHPLFSIAETVAVEPRPIEQLAREQAGTIRRVEHTLTLVSIVLAIIAGMSLLYYTKSFGTWPHYIEAFLWGFGIDSGVKTVADVLKKV